MKYLFLALLIFSVQTASAGENITEMSIYHLNDNWKNHNSEIVQLKKFSGNVIVAAMVYTSCQHTCPMITSKILNIRKSLPKNIENKVLYLMLSFDSIKDTPKKLKAYKEKRGLDDQWVLLTSDESSVRKLAGVLGVNFKKTSDGGFSHSNIISLIDQKGVIVNQITGLNQPIEDMVEQIKKLSSN